MILMWRCPNRNIPEEPVVVLEVHVEHDDDRELERGQRQKRWDETTSGDKGRYVVRPHLPDRDEREYYRDLPIRRPRRMGMLFAVWSVRLCLGGIGKICHAGVMIHRSAVT
jgi:hypothetical protein